MNSAMRHRFYGLLLVVSLCPAPVTSEAAVLEGLIGKPNLFVNMTGFVRSETAVSITSEENPFNQRGNLFNDRTVDRCGAPVFSPTCVLSDSVERPLEPSDTQFNLQLIRSEISFSGGLTENLGFRARIRAVGDPDIYDDQFDIDDVPFANTQGFNGKRPNLFEYRYDDGRVLAATARNPTEPQDQSNDEFEAEQLAKLESEEGSSPLEWAGRDYMVDLPALYLDYQNGPLLLRVGNQQIAWGDMLFFRVLDVANGLDLRRHSVLDFAPEEFSDKRIPSLGIRASYGVREGTLPYNFMGNWEIDGYVQRFRPSILSNPNTPYNVIASQFTVRDEFQRFDSEANYGLRLRGPVGPVDLTLMANRRYNHNGVFQWTDSDVVEGTQPLGPVGNDSLGAASGLFAGQFADTPFETDSTGVASSDEFVTYGALSRLNHFTGLNTAIREFPAAQDAGGGEASTPAQQQRQEDFFFQLAGGLRGHITREYFRENNFGIGFGYRIEGPQDSLLLNQIDLDVEMKYTPDRKFTPLDLNPYDRNLIEEDEYEIAVVMQKFIRYSSTFPSAFAIFQYLHRSESDLAGRHLSGYGADPGSDDPEERLPQGRSSFNAVAIGFQQPSPTRQWRLDFSALYDIKGGLQLQPAVRWKPSTAWTVQVFANWIDTVHGSEYDNALSTLGFADEITTRISYQF